MKHLVALALTVGLAWTLTVIAGPSIDGFRVGAVALGLALIAAALAGGLAARIGLPRVTGYLVFGMICGPHLANLITLPMARELQLINGIAVALIAFIAGLEMNVRRLRPRLRAMVAFGGSTIILLYAVLFLAFWLAWPLLPIAPHFSGLQRLAAAMLLTTLVASLSPTVTIAVIAESRASGPLSEMTLAVVIIADLLLILFFTPAMQLMRFASGSEAEMGLLVSLSWKIFGSFFFGALVGALFAFYLRLVGLQVAVMLVATCAFVSALGTRLGVDTLLAALAAGFVVENLTPRRGDVLKHAVERGSMPILVVFFAAAGASLQLDALAEVGGIALAIAVLRGCFIWISTRIGAAYAGIASDVAGRVWAGLISQAGVTLGLTIIVAGEYPTWGVRVQTLMLALIGLHEFAGPVLFRAALARAGEVGRVR